MMKDIFGIENILLRPFRALGECNRIIGRCPMLLLKDLQSLGECNRIIGRCPMLLLKDLRSFGECRYSLSFNADEQYFEQIIPLQ
jgi:hypothetical protein